MLPPHRLIPKMALFSSTCSAFACRLKHHTLQCVFFFSIRCTDLAALNGSSRRLSVSLRSYYINYFQPATVETKADLISGIRTEIRTIYNNAIGFFVGLRRCVCVCVWGGGRARTGQPARHWRGLRPALPPPRGG